MGNNVAVMPEYYLPVWLDLHEKYSLLISSSYVAKPKNIRIDLVKKHHKKINEVSGVENYPALLEVLNSLELQFCRVISKHTCFYWVHLYRRLSPALGSDLGIRTDWSTLLEVRSIAEQAIFKYGKTGGCVDLKVSDTIPFNSILGGFLEKTLKKLRSSRVSRPAELYKEVLRSSPQLVITDFRPSDLAAVYFIEGLAYQYWYISAKLRAAGKGVKVVADPQGGLEEFRTEDQNTLISNFDQRTETYGISFGFSSNVGTFVWHKDYDSSSGMLFAALNVEQHLLSKIMPDHNLSEDFTPNYLPAYVDIVEYYRAHKYLEKAFAKRHGFGLKELCHVAQIISVILISKVGFSLEGVEGREELLIYQKFQRGYMFHGGPLEDLKKLVLELIRTRPGSKEFEGSNAEEQLSLTFDFLTLSTDKQKNISLWSAGPRYVFVPFNDYYICDYSAWFGIFRSLFFGLRNYDPKSQKGVEFEYAFGALAKYEDFDVVMQSKKINKGDQAREVDVAIRVGDALYLFECRAAERPLDFSLGSPKTIGIRNEDLLVKLNQVKSLADFLDENKIGDNYDVSWAKKVTGIVVSPYTEWVWSLEDDLWLSKDPLIPRVMSATEAIRYLRGIVR